MNKLSPMLALCICISSPAFALGSGGTQTPPKKHAVVNTSKWMDVSLPFRPLNITSQKEALWICGLDETIAVSRDGGLSWHIQHQTRDGEVLLNIAFVDEKIGHAAGTGGLLLSTMDGGETWSPHEGSSTFQDFSFSGLMDGIAAMDGHVGLTSDGGDHWQDVAVMQSDPNVRPFSEIESVAALSPTHFAVALHQPQGENIFLSTVDGGKTWIPTHVANTFAGSLVVHDAEYWAFGIEYLGREHDPGGGYSAAVVLHSKDGVVWEHGVRPTTEFNGCNGQGCYLPQGVVEVLFGDTEKIWSMPQNVALTSRWAMTDHVVCMVIEGLKCGSALASDQPQPPPDRPIPISLYPGHSEPYSKGCIQCSFESITPDRSFAGRAVSLKGVIATFTVNRNGSVGDVSLRALPSKAMADQIAHQISAWLIAPQHNGHHTATDQRWIEINVLCFPGFPGHADSASCSVIHEIGGVGLH